MTFTPLRLPETQPIAYSEKIIAVLSQLQLNFKAAFIRIDKNFWKQELDLQNKKKLSKVFEKN